MGKSKVRLVPMTEWGKDHWSLLAYVETCCVDAKGVIDHRRMRCNVERHPGLALSQHKPSAPYHYPTKLRDGVEPEHDDWDCFYDLEAAGLIEDVGTGINPVAKMTTTGLGLVAALRAHKANGGQFSDFMSSGARS
jgi:hypothetical protein